MFNGNPGPVMRQKSKGTRPKRNRERREARRNVQAGYPIAPRSMTLEEIEQYFSGDKITCLQCGRSLRKIGTHLRSLHNLSVEDYQKMYGLPWRHGLAGRETRKLHSNLATQRLCEDDHLAPYRHLARDGKRRPKQPFHMVKSVENLKMDERGISRWDTSDFDRIIKEVRKGNLLRDFIGTSGWPHMSLFYERCRDDPSLRLAYEEAIESLPFQTQARGKSLGKRFRDEVVRLRDEGLSFSQIAKKLGVTAMAAHSHYKKHVDETSTAQERK